MNKSSLLVLNVTPVKEINTSLKDPGVSRDVETDMNEKKRLFGSVFDKENNQSTLSDNKEKRLSLVESSATTDNEESDEDATTESNAEITLLVSSDSATTDNIKTDTPLTSSPLVNSFPFAGSLATSSDTAIESSQDLDVSIASEIDPSTEINAESDGKMMGGNSLPLSGTNLPGNLHFLSDKETVTRGIESEISQDSLKNSLKLTPEESKTAFQNDKKTASTESLLTKNSETVITSPNTTELINKAIIHSQQLLNSTNPQTVSPQIQQANPSEIAPTLLNASTPNSIEKIMNSSGATGIDAENNFFTKSPVGSPEWNNQMQSRLRWMSNLKISSAELKLHPAELGSIEIKIITEDDQAKVSFVTNNATAKELIESSLPKLRDLLADSGLQLEQSDVSQENLSEENAQQGNGDHLQAENDTNLEGSSVLARQQNLSQYDHYV